MDLRVHIKGDGSGFASTLAGIKGQVASFAGGLSNRIAGIFTLGAIEQFAQKTIELASMFRDMADNLGVNVEWLQKLDYGARMAGASAEDLARFMADIGRSREAAFKDPKGKESQAFGRMGISGADIKNLPTQQFVEKIIGAFKDGATVQLQNDLTEVGGKSAKKLVGAFMAGIDENAPHIKEATVDALDDIGDAFFDLSRSMMDSIAPAIAFLMEQLRKLRDELGKKQEGAGEVLGSAVATFQPIGENKRQAERMEKYRNQKRARGWSEERINSELKKFNLGISSGESVEDDVRTALAKKDEEIARRNDAYRFAQERRRQARREREKAPPSFDAEQPKVEIPTMHRPGDSLIAVGNFLGTGNRANMANIAQQHLDVARKSLAANLRIVDLIQKLTLGGNGLGLPSF